MSGDDLDVTGKGMPRTTKMTDGVKVFLRHNWKGDWFTMMNGTTPYTPVQAPWEHRPEDGELGTRITFDPPE